MELLEERKTSAQRVNRQVGDRATTGTSSHTHLSRGIFWNCCAATAQNSMSVTFYSAPCRDCVVCCRHTGGSHHRLIPRRRYGSPANLLTLSTASDRLN